MDKYELLYLNAKAMVQERRAGHSMPLLEKDLDGNVVIPADEFCLCCSMLEPQVKRNYSNVKSHISGYLHCMFVVLQKIDRGEITSQEPTIPGF